MSAGSSTTGLPPKKGSQSLQPNEYETPLKKKKKTANELKIEVLRNTFTNNMPGQLSNGRQLKVPEFKFQRQVG